MRRYFGKQEMDILVTLILRHGWVTGEELASVLGVSKKTVQQEIRRLGEELGEDCRIHSSQKKGYRLESLSDHLRRDMISDLEKNENHYNMRGRTSALALYLLFQQDFVTMDQLAETFFLSKSTVFSEVKTMKRWMGRQRGISLEVSGTRGVRVLGSELDRRFRCATFCMPGILCRLPGPETEWDRYEEELSLIRKGLGKDLAERNVRISGEDFGKVCRYLAVCLLRNRLGFSLDQEGEKEEHWGFLFSQAELAGFRELLSMASVFSGEDRGEEEVSLQSEPVAVEEVWLEKLEGEIRERLEMASEEPVFSDRDQLLTHLRRLKRRLDTGKYATNYYDKELMIACPLETHLMELCCRRVFGRELPKTELFFLTAYLSGSLEREKKGVDVLLVSNQSPGLTAGLKACIQEYLGCGVKSFRTEPVYLFEAEQTEGREELLLTTEREIAILHREFLLLPAVIRGGEEEPVSRLLAEWRGERKKEKIRRALERYQRPDRLLPGGKAGRGTADFRAMAGWEEDCEISANTVSGGLLFLCRFQRAEETSIQLFELERPMEYNRKSIRRLLAASWCGGREGIFDFFLAVSFLLEENSRKEAKSLPF